MNKIPLIVVAGPTASGKTRLGVELALALDGEVVSADSMQIYKGMDIATAKPTADEMRCVKHHLISAVDLERDFSAADYVDLARAAISDINGRGRLPILVGGTGLYISSLINNIRFADGAGNDDVRRRLYREAESDGGAELYRRLCEADPDAAREIHRNNLVRVVRALEIYELTGRTMTEQKKLSRAEPSPYFPIMLGLKAKDRQYLYDRINARVDRMLADGLLDEARQYAYNEKTTSAQAIGHKELMPYLSGEMTLEEAIERLKRETRRYAKRQLTWFLRDERITWFDIDCYPFEDIVERAVEICKNGLGGEEHE